MIKIEIVNKYKSINPCKMELPKFSVLTGLNGSGKTHLLEAISKSANSNVNTGGNRLTNILYIPFNGLNPNISEQCDPKIITDFVKKFYQYYKQALQYLQNNERNNPRFGQQVNGNNIIQRISNSDSQHINAAQKLIPKITIPFEQVDENYITNIFDVSVMSNDSFFTGQFALIFKNYHKLLEENDINAYYREKRGQTENSPQIYTDEEFKEKYGMPPWDFVNEILESINVPYRVNSPMGTRLDESFDFKLESLDGMYNISPRDLSTGEKVLMSLALAIYNTNGTFNKPELLLIDEPDAPLHPSMSKKMVEVLKNKIVENANIPVIITSHSPTTIICCDGAAVYKMERGNSIPIKTSIQEAIEMLSSDIPFLKISTERRRQVFVESKYDVTYYELITNILNGIAPIECNPIYIPARTSNGSNCTDVINIVNGLHGNGNEQVYGIIDWDTNNTSTDRIIVLGENERYNIESYILDPLLMGLFFLREAKFTPQDMGLTHNSYTQLQNISIEDCKKIIDFVLTRLNLNSGNNETYTTFNEYELEISSEFNLLQGHDLETLYKTKFQFLNSYQREDALKIDVIKKVINDLPELAPKKLYEAIQSIK